MKKITLVLSLFLVIGFTINISSYAATYYVDWDNGDNSNNGTSPSTAWKEPWYADGQVGNGDTVIVYAKDDGSAYTNGDASVVIDIPNGSTWRAVSGETVKLSAGDSWGDNPSYQGAAETVTMDDNATFDGFKVWGSAKIYGNNNTIQNCDLEGGGNATGNDNFPAAIYIHGNGVVNPAQGNLVKNNKIHDNVASVSYSSGHNTTIIMMYYTKDTILENNEIYNSLCDACWQKGWPNGGIFRYNFVYNCVYGWESSESSVDTGPQYCYQNVFVDCTQHGAVPNSGCATGDIYIYNNTFYDCGTNSDGGAIGYWTTRNHCMHIFNNITYFSVSSKHFIYIENAWANGDFNYLDYNCYYNSGSWRINGAVRGTSLSGWQTWLDVKGAGGSTGDDYSVNTDPNFLNGSGGFNQPTDFKRSSYPTNGRGGSYPSVMGAYITGNEIIGLELYQGWPPAPVKNFSLK